MKKIITLSSIILCLSVSAQEYTIGEAVDLGLSVKWASCNVGATSPEEYGNYYAWGEIEEKEDYCWKTYKWCNGTNEYFTKYCKSKNCGIKDNKTILEPEDDVARVKWGAGWRMPTYKEIKELIKKCKWSSTVYNGVSGYKVVGPNGNSIFLPFTGCRNNKTVRYYSNDNTDFFYWSSDLHAISFAKCLNSHAIDLMIYCHDLPGLNKSINRSLTSIRCFGCPVRPVTK